MTARGPLLLALLAAWLYAPDVALLLDVDPSATTYRANGLCGAALALIGADAVLRPAARPHVLDGVVLALAGAFWALQFVCDWWWTPGQPSAAICDDITGRPITAVLGCALLAVAAAADIWLSTRRSNAIDS